MSNRWRERDQRGAALVEAAMVLPLIIVILIGTVEFGLSLADLISGSSGHARRNEKRRCRQLRLGHGMHHHRNGHQRRNQKGHLRHEKRDRQT